MDIYIEIKNKEIVDINTEEVNENYKKYNIKNIDNFFDQMKNNNISSSIEEKIKDILEEKDVNIKLGSFDIKHWVSNRSFGELIDMFESEEIKKPDMQREFVWDSLKCSRLIESIVIGLPIPPLFLLEVDKNEYEIIDGFQRLTTLVNYVNGKPWYDNPNSVRKSKSILSKKISIEIAGKSFDQLEPEYKRMIKRSTIPLIEFKQLDPSNVESKYLIFERINTGSEKLNPMQIRKSLAHGKFIKDLYSEVNKIEDFKDLFSTNRIKKDEHIEAFLRILVMSDIFYGRWNSNVLGIKNILNEYCEENKNKELMNEEIDKFKSVIKICHNIFENPKDMFKKVEILEKETKFIGNVNISIMESFLGVLLNQQIDLPAEEIKKNYIRVIDDVFKKSIEGTEENPFTTSTGLKSSIEKRFEKCKEILGAN